MSEGKIERGTGFMWKMLRETTKNRRPWKVLGFQTDVQLSKTNVYLFRIVLFFPSW